MNRVMKDFTEGFVGAFVLAGAIIMAIISVASAFVHGGADAVQRRSDRTAHS